MRTNLLNKIEIKKCSLTLKLTRNYSHTFMYMYMHYNCRMKAHIKLAQHRQKLYLLDMDHILLFQVRNCIVMMSILELMVCRRVCLCVSLCVSVSVRVCVCYGPRGHLDHFFTKKCICVCMCV